ncbi:TPA: cupin domain-containing protein [candidate division WWE3 bacterium]|uniref:Cupin type-2 domain-containing protein n=4 Tax=Katanobacteria TaxID=422282 RepID=A0A0G1NJT9_UNCKA|nr:MAG: hypothetical protein UW65_C0005G0006 [candidate division WWE3 bacterium GW2011_GWB1_44_4]KKT84464.1 MAG: hypothetical protein UW82_C0021G0006 [candidate division WWE3 bacterium GW2011_GWC2_44_9]OGC52901.1 MAG: cupin [candidate division WWE3 bacterium RIFCSPHIGHO2_01_FULL_43_9]HAZ29769.1 cupin domain-containing protein [candidate division WWE3 bacterium]
MQGYHANIEDLTLANEFFRKVLFTGPNSQLVLMALQPGEEIGREVHQDHDQFFRFEQGAGKVEVDGSKFQVSDGLAVVVPAGAWHNVINTGKQILKLYTIYSPPEHKDGTVHKTKAEALAAHH